MKKYLQQTVALIYVSLVSRLISVPPPAIASELIQINQHSFHTPELTKSL